MESEVKIKLPVCLNVTIKVYEMNPSNSLDFGSKLGIVNLILNCILVKALMRIEETYLFCRCYVWNITVL
jgi:hypothetical protein